MKPLIDTVTEDPVVQLVLFAFLVVVVMDTTKWFFDHVWKKLGGDDEE